MQKHSPGGQGSQVSVRTSGLPAFLLPDARGAKDIPGLPTFWNPPGQLHRARREDDPSSGGPEPSRDNGLPSCLPEETQAGSSSSLGTHSLKDPGFLPVNMAGLPQVLGLLLPAPAAARQADPGAAVRMWGGAAGLRGPVPSHGAARLAPSRGAFSAAAKASHLASVVSPTVPEAKRQSQRGLRCTRAGQLEPT